MPTSRVWPVGLSVAAAVAAGALASLQTRVLGTFAAYSGPAAATLLVGGGGAVTIVTVSLLVPSMRRSLVALVGQVAGGAIRWWPLPGVFSALVAVAQASVAPVVGVAMFSSALVAGTAVGALVADRSRAVVRRLPVTPRRVVAATVTVAAVLAGVGGAGGGPVWFALAAVTLLVGVGQAFQNALLGRTAAVTGRPEPGAVLLFVVAGVLGAIGVAALAVAGQRPLDGVAGAPWWSWSAAPLGVLVILTVGPVVRSIGALAQGLSFLVGQLGTGLVLDLLAPSAGVRVGWATVLAVTVTAVAVVVAATDPALRAGRASQAQTANGTPQRSTTLE